MEKIKRVKPNKKAKKQMDRVFKAVTSRNIFANLLYQSKSQLVNISRIVVKPFFFAKESKWIIVPYVYIFIGMCFLFVATYIFLKLCWLSFFDEGYNVAIILPTLAGVIATLTLFVKLMADVYNKGKDKKSD